ncbi:RHS repeat-associated core domain-containing protein [Pseudomonas asiatica]|uniref:RHS repeat-associated core domain-containing protein n=1 Tax=Pseudomonas asiatica TaxID=2219225 RepID=UPI00256FB97A|nr:RHS repeat-associated core domain-containing protein [Pseudomonas asiatica]WJD71141.1 RHS repeat-associated core domain-containing protein [Pseudomonas asiatica]
MDLQRKTLKLFYCDGDMHTSLRHQGSRTVFRVAGQSLAELRVGTVDSVSLLSVNNAGSVVGVAQESERAQFDYTAYGHCSSLSSGRSSLGFNGEYYDDLLQGYMLGNGYRLFNGMRFNSPDSFAPFRVLNAYGYCGDPVNYSDPSGHAPFPLFFFTRRSYFKMKRVMTSAQHMIKKMDISGTKPYDPALSRATVNRNIETRIANMQKLAGQVERVKNKEGSRAYRELSRKYEVGSTIADYRKSLENYKARLDALRSRHATERVAYVERLNHNRPIQHQISQLVQQVGEERGKMKSGNKFDADLSSDALARLEKERDRYNAPYEKTINDLNERIAALRSGLQ